MNTDYWDGVGDGIKTGVLLSAAVAVLALTCTRTGRAFTGGGFAGISGRLLKNEFWS